MTGAITTNSTFDGRNVSGDGSKLDGIDPNSNNFTYTHPTSSGNKHIPTGGASGQFLKYSSSGTAVWASSSGLSMAAALDNRMITSNGGTSLQGELTLTYETNDPYQNEMFIGAAVTIKPQNSVTGNDIEGQLSRCRLCH